MSDEVPRDDRGIAVWTLIAVRFLLELALWSSFTVAMVRLVGGPAGWLTGLLLTSASIVLWGMLLSPRRSVRLDVRIRIVVELVLFSAAATLLAVSGLVIPAIVLMVVEVVDLTLLKGPDRYAP